MIESIRKNNLCPTRRRSLISLIRTASAIAVMLLCTYNGPEAAPNTCEDTYSFAISLVKALYPQLTGKGANVDIDARYPLDANGPLLAFYIRVSPSDQIACYVDPRSPNPSSAERVGQFGAHFQFDGRDQRIFSMSASGSIVNSEKQEALTKEIDEHPSWTEAQMTDALARAGATFGPSQKQQLLAAFPFKNLEPIVGTIEPATAEFTFRANDHPPHYAVMDWSIRFRAKTAGGLDEYTVALEPFAGKVISLGRMHLQE